MCPSVINVLLFVCSASFSEAGEAPLQSYTSHPGRQGGHEGQSLTHEKSRPRLFTLCTRLCQTISMLCQTIGWECLRVSLWMNQPYKPWQTSLWRRPKISNTTPTNTVSQTRGDKTSQPKRLDSESGVVMLCSKFPGVAFMLGLNLTKKMPSSM